MEDRRTRKTKQALRLGLAELLAVKNIQQITVKELADKVDIHRSTFYANFEDIGHLYNHLEDVTLEEISLIATSCTTFEPKIFFKMLLTYIAENPQICRLFFGGRVSQTFNHRLTELFLDAYLDYLCEKYNLDRKNEQLKYYELFCFTGTLAIIEKWVTGEFNVSETELIDMLADIDEHWGSFVANRFSKKLKKNLNKLEMEERE